MRYAFAVLAALILTLVACGDEGSEGPARNSGSTVHTTRTPGGTASKTSPPAATTPSPSADEPLLRIGFTVHLEGWQPGATVAERYASHIREYAALFEGFGARATWEASETAIAGSAAYGDNVLLEMQERGHGVGAHADVGGSRDDTYLEIVTTLTRMKADLEALGIVARHASGICSHLDWVGAAIEAGIDFVTGTVSYCWSSVPEAERPAEYRDCDSPTACHDAQPADLPGRIHPWRTSTSLDWITHDPAGELTIFPSSGGLVCRDGERTTNPSPGGCSFDQGDIDAYIMDLEAVIAASTPGELNSYYVVFSLGAPPDITVLESWLRAVQPYVDSGQVEWATLPQMYDAFLASEGS